MIPTKQALAGLPSLAIALAVPAGTAYAADTSPPPSLEAFFSAPAISEVELSPSGRQLALVVPGRNGRNFLAVVDVDLKDKPLGVAGAAYADIQNVHWTDDDWLVYQAIDLQSGGREQTFGPGLFAVRRDGTQQRRLMRTRWDEDTSTGTNIASRVLDPNHRLLRVPDDGTHDVIVGEYKFDNLGDFESITPKRLDVSTGVATRIAQGAPAHARAWVFDRAGVPRAVTTAWDGRVEVSWRDAADAPWRSLAKTGEFGASWAPRAIDSAGTLYVSAATPASTAVLKRFDFTTGAPEAESLAATPGFDVRDPPLFDEQGRLIGFRLVTDAESTIWFDPLHKKLQALADARYPGRVNRILCRHCDGDGALLVHSFGDHDPGTWSVYRPATDVWVTVGAARAAIDPRRMADLDLHRIKARDGLELPVWVTRPRGTTGPLPAVLLVHGGPWARGVSWRWSAEAQFLASRGYVVIEPEFRGSRGYGGKLFRAGWKHWGTTMQDDLADAVRWAGEQKLVDPDRVCIVGASYGGYAALMAPIRYPDVFKCSVAYVAVSDPRLMFENSWQNDASRQDIQFSLPTLIGDPVRDAAMLKAAAPIERAGELNVPVLLAYGREDRRVPLVHGERMRAALEATGHEPEFVVYDGEGHGFLKAENRYDFYGRMEKFLQRHLAPGRATPPATTP